MEDIGGVVADPGGVGDLKGEVGEPPQSSYLFEEG